MLARVLSSNRMIVRGVVFGALLGTTLGIAAVAQPPRGSGLPPEELAKVQAAQAKTVAADLKLDAEKTGKLVDAFAAFQKESAENPPAGAPGDREAMLKLMEERQAKLADSLKAFLDEAVAKQAAANLGGFNRGWDQMVSAILGFGLDEGKTAEALGHTLAYLKSVAKAREDAAGDRDTMRTAMAAAKKTLDDSLAPMLSDAQKTEWAEKTTRGQRGGGGGGQRRER